MLELALCLDCLPPCLPSCAVSGLLSVETYTCCDSPPPEQELRELLGVVDIFSPNLDEAVSIVGDLGTPQQLVQRLVQLGAHTVALRMGEQGVLVASRRQEQDGQVMCCQVGLGLWHGV